jgi:FkbH-like protein
MLYWEDHCLECSAPLCYSSCSMFVARPDKRCARFFYGIYPNSNFKGFFDFGADVRFRRWGKVETIVHGKIAGVGFQRLLDRVNRLASFLPDDPPKGKVPRDARWPLANRAKGFWKTMFGRVRNKGLAWFAPSRETAACDAFVMECYSPEAETFRLVLEYSAGTMTADHTFVGDVRFRHSFQIGPGWNFETMPAEFFNFGRGNRVGKITLYPENNAERRLIFTWLDLVQFRETPAAKPSPKAEGQRAAAKVKCVAWDLDYTLWKGILAETDRSSLVVRPEAEALIKKLDEVGVIQTVVSKNNYADAWPVIQSFGLDNYFLYPAINWQPKSGNLKGIAKKLNINVDTFAVIDDSSFERAEIQSALPQVRVYTEQQISELLSYPEFDLPVTEASRERRASYQVEITRQTALETFDGDYLAFLRGCEMKLRLFIPCKEQHVLRCHELIQRANQLNLSGRRYTDGEFRRLLSQPGMLCVAMACGDRFGDYGIVGFASTDESGDRPVLRDLVLSCRVAQKRVEHAFVQWLAHREASKGKLVLRAELVRTDRNAPLLQVFDDLSFAPAADTRGGDVLELAVELATPPGGVVTVVVEGALGPLSSAITEPANSR